MAGVLAGFAVIWTIILVGSLVGRSGVLGEGSQRTLSQFSFWVASPCLLFLTVAEADIAVILSAPLAVALMSAWSTVALWWALQWGYSALRRRRSAPARGDGEPKRPAPTVRDGVRIADGEHRPGLGQVVMSGQAASQVNSANLGIPLTTFVLGDASYVVPVILFQLAINTPVYLTVMDIVVLGRRPNVLSILRSVITNPMVMGSLLGVLFAATGWQLPEIALQPVELIAGAAIPCMLAAFGMSLTQHKPLQGPRSHKLQVLVLSVLKLLVMPALAWLFGLALGLEGSALFGVVLMASLPTAQNVYVAAVRYRTAQPISRDVVLVTSVIAMLTMALVALILA
ncbi:AEC family transporter [Kocuria coralli]|uniref:AEC family transporter n=1 Tax=Kocuria coralli TaxID=1461025 RepID=A0A5J5L0K1_9MICC|nr:AEC family transporter [Kocuria coralli]KAA9395363.1 AEC family transporter [Kocuria coralli]